MSQKVWLITGANRGLGRCFAEEAARRGDCVVCAMRRIPEDPFYRQPNVLAVPMDVTDQAAVDSGVRAALERFGRIDILINNAGFGMMGAMEEISVDELRVLFDTDYYGIIRVSQAVLPSMRAQRSGMILNVSSQAGLVSGPGNSAYNAVKYAVVGLSQSMRLELAAFGIQVCAVCPGPFRTDFRDGSSMKEPISPMAAYDGTPAHDMIDYLHVNNHKQNGDPARAAAFVCSYADRDDLPGILVLGGPACDSVRDHYAAILKEMDGYYEASSATAFEE